ncbi:branched-chain amino acid transport system substrate-binding protein [Mesorhizobium soli]|uniref:ABC transporter substrate-binding protein n=1 Tax=Pseudaminobacter soli (ex Li et al. 2025) TaxID=1295366 RepID=UPI002474C794|nr:ABC transporter substrate-binding protein [Mesorhizobium soli]MDH6231824.1 branched-chain amino acid transport system substrate-binding protein [Mesorhizobium soli]
MKTKHLGLASLLLGASALATPALADVNIGLLNGITGGAAAMAPAITKSLQFAVDQINEQGGVLQGEKLVGIMADDGCSPQVAADAATKLVNVSQVIGVVGPLCSGALMAAANSATIPAGVILISQSATSPEITTLKDNDLVFRTIPSDEYQGQALARTLLDRGTKKVAVSFINNDYGKGIAEAFKKEYEAKGGEIAGYEAHEENKSSYRADLAGLAQGGADTLVLLDYGDTSGLTVLREAIENGFFEKFVGAEGMKTSAPIKAIGADNLTTFMASAPVSTKSEALDIFNKVFAEAGGDINASYVGPSYDAVFLLALAIEKAGGDKSKLSESLRAVSNGEGEPILPGEWKKAKELIAAGKAIDYKGASGELNFDANGDVPGSYALFKVAGDDWAVETEMK